ncbi:carbohydrate binding family 9 domain-containing protein [Algoriphagus confluentis]|uniref:Carbohydrate family 9 binding domain-like n=1 Tax=Algoriphagus confluentis TaxID=1697556 RepID=A0ABQ6PTN7_9BACT|nr:hypothetical protein Aconfl_39510 [Algoriphagus confluentis]
MKKLSKHLAAILIGLASPFSNILAQNAENFPPPEIAPIMQATKAKGKITLDGKLDEEDWKQTSYYGDFFMLEPRQGGQVEFPTQVRILFDENNLYIGAFCADSLGKKGIRVQDLRRDFRFGENDIFLVQLDPQQLKRFAVSFQSTPLGNQRDAQIFDDSLIDNDWDALWRVRTSLMDSGYFVEMAIPFKSLRYTESDDPTWGITVARLARRKYEFSVTPAIPQAFTPYRMTYAADLKGLELPPPSVNIRIQPYGLAQVNRQVDNQGVSTQSTEWKAGGEVKWAVSPSSVLDLTFNTDFAQADVDRAVNNLTRFNVFFPERRQFFLENNGVYAGADNEDIRPFFSRTIGLSNSQFNADPVPIDAGVRFTDRNQERSLAGLYVHQRGTPFQSAVNFGVARYLKNYGEQNNIGVMLTQRIDEADPENGRIQQSNTTVTVDGFIRPKDELTISYLVSGSRQNNSDSMGVAASFFAGYTPNNFYAGWLTRYVDQKYHPGMGFVFAQNVIYHNPGGYYIWRPARGWLSKWVRRADPGFFVNWYQTASTLATQEVSVDVFPIYIITKTNGLITYTITPTWQNFDFSFDILGQTIPAGQYEFIRHEFVYRTDQSKKLSLNSEFTTGSYYDGSLNSLTVGGRVAPSPYFALDFSIEHNAFEDFGENRTDFTADLWTAGIRVAANPRLQLSGFYQYNSLTKSARINVRGSWEFAPLSFLFLVFNESSFQESPVNNQSLISKITYLKQF